MRKPVLFTCLLFSLLKISSAQCRLDYTNYIPIFTETFDGIDSVNQLSPSWKFWFPDDSSQGVYYGWLSEMWSKQNIIFRHEDGKDLVRLVAQRLPKPLRCDHCPDFANYRSEKKFVSGMLELVAGEDSMPGYTYGIFEASIRFSGGSGAWPAFWMVGSGHPFSKTEIDIVDGYFTNERVWKSALIDWDSGNSYLVENKRTDEDLVRNFHLYSVVWTPQKLSYFLDGVELFSFSNPVASKDKSAGGPHLAYTRPEKLIVLLTMEMAEWASVDAAHMDIDYVKVYKPCSKQNGGCKPLLQLTPYDYNTTPYLDCGR